MVGLNGLRKVYRLNDKILEILEGDITKYDGDAIIVPANIDFDYDGELPGVLGSIVRAAGEQPFIEAIDKGNEIARRNGFVRYHGMNYDGLVQPFDGVVTSGGNLEKSLIHIVSKDFTGHREPISADTIGNDGSYIDDVCVRETVKSGLRIAEQNSFGCIGFPVLGAGLYHIPIEVSVRNMVETMREHLQGQTSIHRVSIIPYGHRAYISAEISADIVMRKNK